MSKPKKFTGRHKEVYTPFLQAESTFIVTIKLTKNECGFCICVIETLNYTDYMHQDDVIGYTQHICNQLLTTEVWEKNRGLLF